MAAGDPQRIGGYWLAGRLGAGGQGVVYEAYDAGGARVALKVLHGGDRHRMEREAEAARRVASFCTARVLAVELDGPRPFIASEYVPGPSLRRAVTQGRRFAGDDLVRLATAVATALTAIHEAGVVHRDLKPDNVLLGPDGPRVIDFGIARTADMSLTRTGEVSGTPTYMAPEVLTGVRAGPPADVFAWGAVVVFAATGRDPFHADNLGGVMHRVLSSQPDLTGLPEPLAALVGAALSKDPEARPAARDLLLALLAGGMAGGVAGGVSGRVAGTGALGAADTGRLLAAGSASGGGVRGLHGGAHGGDPALGAIAEDAYAALAPEERELAAEVFLRLVTVTDDGQEAARRAPLEDLYAGRAEEERLAVERILAAFAYVVAHGGGEVSLSRPALLRAWPRLRAWVEAERAGLAVLAQISGAARQWDEHGRKDGDLFQGSRLETALNWAATGRRHVTLTPRERDFLQAGTALTRRRARRRALTTTALAGLLVVALAAGGLAAWQGAQAAAQREQTARQRDVLAARQVAAEADGMRTTDPVLAMLLSVAAWRVSPQPEARSALVASSQQDESAVFRDPPAKGVARRTLSRDGRTLVSVSEDGVNLYDVRTGRRTGGWPLGMKGEILQDPSLSRSGRLLAQTTTEELAVWDVATGRRLLDRPLPPASNGGLRAVFGEHESTVAVSFADDLYRVFDVATGEVFSRRVPIGADLLVDPTGRRLLLPGDGGFREVTLPGWTSGHRYARCRTRRNAVAFTADGRTLACAGGGGGAGGSVVLLDAAGGRVRDSRDWDCDICGYAVRLRFSADGRRLAAFNGRDIRVWTVADHREVLAYRAPGALSEVRFDAGGATLRYLMDDTAVSLDLAPRVHAVRLGGHAVLAPGGGSAAVGGFEDRWLRLWDLRRRAEVGRVRVDPEALGATGFDATGRRLVVAEPDVIRLVDAATGRTAWTVPTPHGKVHPPYRVAFSPDGRTVAVTLNPSGQTLDFRVLLLDAATGRVLHDSPSTLDGGPFTPDGTRLASIYGRFEDVATGRPVGSGFSPSPDGVSGVAVSRNGLMAVSTEGSGRITLWDVDGPTALPPALPSAGSAVGVAGFSPDGSVLAGVTGTGVQLWDVTARHRLGGPFVARSVEGIDSLEFSADGSMLYASVDEAVLEIPVGPERVAAAVCRRAGRDLTRAEWDRHLEDVPYRRVCPAYS
ncbi:WD40 repeat domain-containing serine/threonine protein kinase [Nonomuraea pusilla]|uniref:WD40 repeat domain-containing serine/threonine protein kinase n=1 Tax=Nonomuraea pusilla TaxID=46177 RepID=UPI0015A62F08|nr:serine/threonine-protein kinase [Nonomuraea pusilla]